MEQQLKAEELFDKDEAFLFTMIGNELGPLGFAFDNRDDEEKGVMDASGLKKIFI